MHRFCQQYFDTHCETSSAPKSGFIVFNRDDETEVSRYELEVDCPLCEEHVSVYQNESSGALDYEGVTDRAAASMVAELRKVIKDDQRGNYKI